MNTNTTGVPQTPDLNNPNTNTNVNLMPNTVLNVGAPETPVNNLPPVEQPLVVPQPEQAIMDIPVVEPVAIPEQPVIVENVLVAAEQEFAPQIPTPPQPAQEVIAPPVPTAVPVVDSVPVVQPVIDEKARLVQAEQLVDSDPQNLAALAKFADDVDKLSPLE
jgi:hypothetical protein